MTADMPPTPPSTAAVGSPDAGQRLYTRLRQALTTDLPARVEAMTRGGDGPPPLARRRDIGREVLEDAVAAHSEAELVAGRDLADAATEARLVEQVLDE